MKILHIPGQTIRSKSGCTPIKTVNLRTSDIFCMPISVNNAYMDILRIVLPNRLLNTIYYPIADTVCGPFRITCSGIPDNMNRKNSNHSVTHYSTLKLLLSFCRYYAHIIDRTKEKEFSIVWMISYIDRKNDKSDYSVSQWVTKWLPSPMSLWTTSSDIMGNTLAFSLKMNGFMKYEKTYCK